MSKPASTVQNYAQAAASKVRSGASTPSGTAAVPPRQTAPAVNGQSSVASTATPSTSGDRDGVVMPKQVPGSQPVGINFGTLNDTSAPLSSSPAAPATFATHLQPGGKPTFGSIASSGLASTTSVSAGDAGVSTKASATPSSSASTTQSSTPATVPAKPDFNAFFREGGGIAAPMSSSTAGGSAPVSGPSSEAPSASSSAAQTPAMPSSALPMDSGVHQRRPSVYEGSISSSTSSPRPPSAVLPSPQLFAQPSNFAHSQGSLPGAPRSFSPAGSAYHPQGMAFVPQANMYGHQKTPSGGGGYAQMPSAQYQNGAPRQSYGAPPAGGSRPGQQRFNSSTTPASPRLPNATLPQQASPYAYGIQQQQQWAAMHYANGQPYMFPIHAPGYPSAASSPFLLAQQQQQAAAQQSSQSPATQALPAVSVNGSATSSIQRASSASPAPSPLSMSSIATGATSNTPAASISTSQHKPNPNAPGFNVSRDFKQVSKESKAIVWKKPPASPAKPTEVKKPATSVVKPADAAKATEASAPAQSGTSGTPAKPADEAAEMEQEKKAKEAREAADAEKERVAKQAAEAEAAAAAETKRKADEQAANIEAARLEKLRLDDEAAKAEIERKTKEQARNREKEAAEAAERAAEDVATASPEQKQPALVDASAPAHKPADMPAIAEAEANKELAAPVPSSSASSFPTLYRPIHDEGVPRTADDDSDIPSAPVSAVPSRAATPPTQLQIPSKPEEPTGPPPLATAKPVQSLSDITYPEGIVAPRSELNTSIPAGHFRYDRTFLLQFDQLCQDRPEGMPDAETLGMQDHESQFNTPTTPRSSTGRYGRGASGMPPPPMRQPSMGMSGRGGMQAMGAFGTVPKSSEARFQQATAQMAMGGFGSSFGGKGSLGNRTPSQQMGSRSGSKRGSNRNASSRGAAPNAVQYGLDGQPVAPLQKTENAWSDNINKSRASGKVDDTSPEMVQRKVKGLLNKLTVDNFSSISKQILAWADKSKDETDGRILRQIIQLIFEKATDEAAWSTMYARLCRMLQDTISEKVQDHSLKDAKGKPFPGGTLFRKYLLNRCQEDYQRGWANRDDMTAAAASKAAEDEAKRAANAKAETEAEEGKGQPKEAEILSDEYYAAQKAKRQGLGLVKFIGELFKLHMLTARIMHECIRKLLSDLENPEEEDVESLCRLLTTVGHLLDGSATNNADPNSQKAAQIMKIYFDRLEQLRRNDKLSSRIRFMIQDLAELRQNGWQGRTDAAGPKTIQEIHADAARQQQEEARRAMSGGRGLPPRMAEGLPRGGSRGGRERSGPDGWSTIAPTAPPARPSKAGDLKAFGQMRTPSSTGGPSTTFAPSGAFAIKGRASSAKEIPSPAETPRQNAFAALEAPETAESDSGRPRLNLAPRTLPLEGEEEAGADQDAAADVNGEEAEEDAEPARPALDDAAIKRSIDNSIKEFFELKSFEEAILACQDLPEPAKPDFVAGLSLKVIDMREEAVLQLCDLFDRFIDEDVMRNAEMGEGFKPLLKDLDDLAADAPKAFKYAAKLLRSTDLTEDDVVRISEVMESIEGDDDEARQEVRDRLLDEWRKHAPVDSQQDQS